MKDYKINFLFCLIFLFSYDLFAQSLKDGVTSSIADLNNIKAQITNNGGVGEGITILWDNPQRISNEKNIVYDMGLQIAGKINGEIVSAFSQWSKTYSPGPILDGKAAMISHPENQSKYRVYKILKGDDSSNPDYAEWPVEYGAPVDNFGNPLMLGDENLYCVYNSFHDAVPTAYPYLMNLKSIPIEIHQYTYSLKPANANSIMNDVMFMEYLIINKGDAQIDSMNIGFWADVDFYDGGSIYNNNIPAVDVQRNLGYCWSEIDTAETMVAVGVTQLFGPLANELNSNATFKGKTVNNKKNLPLSAFHGILDDATNQLYLGPISDNQHVWYYANGLDKDGNEILNPITNQATKFPFDGDPVANSGWIWNNDSLHLGGGAGFTIFSGNFTLASNDTQWVMYALVPAIGKTGKDAIVDLRNRVDSLQSLSYNEIIITAVKDDNKSLTSLPDKFWLSQNYPNPFNPSTTIKYSIPLVEKQNFVPVQLKVYDILGREVATLVNEQKAAGNYEVKFDASDMASGIYLYKLQVKEFMQTRNMILLR